MEEHIRGCQRCTAVLEGTRNVVQLYGDERMLEVPLGFSNRLQRRLDENVHRSRRSFLGWMVAAAATIVVIGGFEVARSSRHQPHWAAFGTRSTRNRGSPGHAGPGFNGWEDISCVWVPVHSRPGTSSDHRGAGSAARRLRSLRVLHEEVLETGLTSLLAPADTRSARLSFEWAEAQLPRMKMSLLDSTGLCFAASLLGRRCAARRSTATQKSNLKNAAG